MTLPSLIMGTTHGALLRLGDLPQVGKQLWGKKAKQAKLSQRKGFTSRRIRSAMLKQLSADESSTKPMYVS
jgi:hypothetical protein